MTTVIEDGTGDSYKLKVDDENRAWVNAVTEPQADHASERGNRYNINTGYFVVTNDSKTTVLYMKNTGIKKIIITSLIYNIGTSTGGSGDARVTWVRNPNSGDIITNANTCDMISNQNYGSQNEIDAVAYKGASGETVATSSGSLDGDSGASIVQQKSRIALGLGATTLDPGSAIGVDYTPPSGNTSQLVNFAIACYVQTLES